MTKAIAGITFQTVSKRADAMNTLTSKPIIIVGGGIGGLTAAYALARKGFSVQLLEQAPEFTEIGAGIQFGPNAFKMMNYLGLQEGLDQLMVYPDELVMMGSITSKRVADIPVAAPFRERFGFPYALIHRADLLVVLLDACKRQEKIE